MCDRTKSEFLARELCIEFWAGQHHEVAFNYSNKQKSLDEFVTKNWEHWEKRAIRMISMLEQHKE